MATRRRAKLTVPLFVLAGWLFADLFVGTSVLFLVGNTVGRPAPMPTPTATSTPTPTPLPSPTPTLTSIDPSSSLLQFTISDPAGFIGGNVSEQAAFINTLTSDLRAQHRDGHRVGIVLVTSGQTTNLAESVQAVLVAKSPNFENAVFRTYFRLGADSSYLSVEIFFFR